jgi:YbgC/YbaW family acyl-CoA thioester hydrolase
MTGASKPFVYSTRIRFADTDASGRIHNAAIFPHFEAAEAEFFRAHGHPYTDLETRDVVFPRVHVEASFQAALRAEDPVEIQVAVARVGQRSYSLAFTVLCRGVKAASGRITAAAMSRRTQRACALPEALAATLRGRL